jgi:hypothetical protein
MIISLSSARVGHPLAGGAGSLFASKVGSFLASAEVAAVSDSFVNNVGLVGVTTRFWHKDSLS